MESKKISHFLFDVIWFGPVLAMVALPFLFFPWAPAFLTGMVAFGIYNLFQGLGFGNDDDLDDVANIGVFLRSTFVFCVVSLFVPMAVAFLLAWIGLI